MGAFEKIVKKILDEPVRSWLQLAALRSEDGGAQWCLGVSVVEDLVQSISLDPDVMDNKKRASIAPDIISRMSAGFDYISYNRPKAKALINELTALYVQLNKIKPRGTPTAF